MNSIVLIVDNDTTRSILIENKLRNESFQVESVTNVESACAAMTQMSLACLLVTCEIGLDNLQKLKQFRDRQHILIPLILLQNHEQENSQLALETFSFDGHIQLPLIQTDLEVLEASMAHFTSLRDAVTCSEEGTVVGKQLVQTLLDESDEAQMVLSTDGIILNVNERAASICQISASKAVGVSLFLLVSEDLADAFRKSLSEVMASRSSHQIEYATTEHHYQIKIFPVCFNGEALRLMVRIRKMMAQSESYESLLHSEMRYRSIYEAARDAIVIFERKTGKILACNAAARKLYGYATEEIPHIWVNDIVDQPQTTLHAIQYGIERVSISNHRRKNGSLFPAEMTLNHFHDAGRDVCVAFVLDMTQRKMAEEALREGARLYRAVVEDQTELICRYSPVGKLNFVNEAFARFFDVDEDDIIGQNFFPKLAPGEKHTFKKWIQGLTSSQPVVEREQHVALDEAETRWVRWTIRAIFDNQKQLAEFQAVGRDITERKDTEGALLRATEEKEQYRINLEATFRSIPDGIISVDDKLNVIATNSAATMILGLENPLRHGQKLEELLERGNPCLGVLRQVLQNGKPVRGYEAELCMQDMTERIVELNCTHLVRQGNREAGAVLVIRDVSRIVDLEKRLHERHGFRGIIGRSSEMQSIYRLLEQISSLDSIVLILGESGTGKELVADALHYGGSRAGCPLIKVNCSALSESLLESELFGHVRGAFTGAVHDKIGRIQAAEGGTLFLDELGDISPLIQLKILRFLEQKEYERVGESKTMTADVRIIAATNVDLRAAVMQGKFREDLYYRLNVMPVQLPPLRERQADIPLLVSHFLDLFSEQFNKTFNGVRDDVMDLFMSYSWPGNIRELRHILEHACILSPGNKLSLSHIRRDLIEQMRIGDDAFTKKALDYTAFSSMQGGAFPHVGEERTMQSRSREISIKDILQVVEQCKGNKTQAARELGIHRATLYRKLKGRG